MVVHISIWIAVGKHTYFFENGDWYIKIQRDSNEDPRKFGFRIDPAGLNSEELYWFNKKIEQLKSEVG